MKKTLFSALLLAGATLFAVTPDVLIQTSPGSGAIILLYYENSLIGGGTSITSSNNVITFGEGNPRLTSYAITFTLDVLNNPSSPILSASGTNAASGWGIYINGTTAQFNNGSSAWDKSDSLTVSQGDTLTFLHISQNGAIGNGSSYILNQTTGNYIEATSDDGYLYTYDIGSNLVSGTARLWTNGGKAQMTLLGVTDLSAYSLDGSASTEALTGISINGITVYGTVDANEAVPEPSTSVLSLLALAGLAARRRRK